jgi:hypothetical protein
LSLIRNTLKSLELIFFYPAVRSFEVTRHEGSARFRQSLSNGQGRIDIMRFPFAGIAALSVVFAAEGLVPGAPANAETFTWDPSGAVPSLTVGPAAFTADNIAVTNYLHSVNTNNLVTLQQTFVEDFIQPVSGFTLHGNPVTAPGLNASYGLYFSISAIGQFPINGAGAPVGPATFSTLNMSLIADVTHDDGSVSSTQSGVSFSNPTGVLNDVTLATGTLESAALSRDTAGLRHAHFIDTFVPSAGQAGFFVGPDIPLGWEEFLTTLPAAFQLIQVDPLTSVQLVNGDLGSTGQVGLIPEPATLSLLSLGFVALIAGRRRIVRSV